MIHRSKDTAQAVLFIGNEGVVKELLYPEFEAILDGFVPLIEWADRTARAVYIELNSDYCAKAAVFFTVSFDQKGAVDRSWNLPLLDLARTSATGPDMGAGPIHLVCASQCPVALFRDFLWNPDLKPGSNHLAQIKKALKRNKLNLVFKQPDTDPQQAAPGGAGISPEKLHELGKKMGENYQKELRDHVAQLLKDQRLQMSTLAAEKDQAVNQVRAEYLHKIEALQEVLALKQAALDDADKHIEELKYTIDGQVQKIEGLREYFEKKLERNQGVDTAFAESIKRQSAAEAEARIAAAAKDADERLKMKDMELIFRREHEDALQKELAELREENQELIDNGGDFVLEKLSRRGVNFVTYQPGAGHITIPLTQIAMFLENPQAFTAGYCGVSEKHYAAWLAHYQAPLCQAEVGNGETCGAALERLGNPLEFVDGESNYCAEHNRLKTLRAVKT